MMYIFLGLALILALALSGKKREVSDDIAPSIKAETLKEAKIEATSAVRAETSRETKIDTSPDSPIGFGYKCMWIAIKSTDQNRIADELGLSNPQKSNWQSGIEKAYSGSVFITPAIDQWTLIVGTGLSIDRGNSLMKIKRLLDQLSSKFGETQYFVTHRVVEYHSWIRSLNGKIVRVYTYLGESGENSKVLGEETIIEQKWNLVNTLSEEAQGDVNYFQRKDLTFPDEEIVMEVAQAWSINPTTLDKRKDVKGLGLVGKIR